MQQKTSLRDYCKYNRILTDGAFGTFFTSIAGDDIFPEQANLDKPELVRQVHLEYLKAGAALLRTNTFAANTENMHGGLPKILDCCEKAYILADEAREEYIAKWQKDKRRRDIFIAGDMGPMTFAGEEERQRAYEEYLQIARQFIALGADALLFETFPSLDVICDVIRQIRCESDIFIWVQISVNQMGYSGSGLSARTLWKEMLAMPQIDAIGLNCGVGPGHLCQIMKQMLSEHFMGGNKVISALPNAGYPKIVRGQVIFSQNETYFSEKMAEMAELGVGIVGGCCGSTPDFIAAVKKRFDEKRELWDVDDSFYEEKTESAGTLLVTKEASPNWLSHPKRPDGKLIAVELSPPPSAKDEKVMEAAHLLKKMDVDVVTFPDSPSGRTRADSILMAAKVRRETNLTVMPHICCRDKNAIAIRSQILGADLSDIKDFLVVTGDPIPTMARAQLKSVFHFDSVGLMRIIREINEAEFGEKETDAYIRYGGAINQNRLNLGSEIRRVQKKMEAGAQFFLTQPMFTEQEAQRVLQIKQETGAKILCGIMPLISRKNALFIQNEMTGMCVTQEIVERFAHADTREAGEAVGVQLAKQMMELTYDFADGFYFSIPFNRVYLLQDIL